jgi:hypothetical protein
MGYTFELLFVIMGAGFGVFADLGICAYFHLPKIVFFVALVPSAIIGLFLGLFVFRWLITKFD